MSEATLYTVLNKPINPWRRNKLTIIFGTHNQRWLKPYCI